MKLALGLAFPQKIELVCSEDKHIKWHIGYSLGTLYEKRMDDDTIELWNLGYCPATKDFYYNKSIHFPKEIVGYFNGAAYTKRNIALMEEYGIYNLQVLTDLYEESLSQLNSIYYSSFECCNERIRRK